MSYRCRKVVWSAAPQGASTHHDTTWLSDINLSEGSKRMKTEYRKDETYFYDYVKIIKFNDDRYKVIQFKFRVKQSGFEEDKKQKLIKKENVITDYLAEEYQRQSISRTKKRIYEYALCNEFDYFITLTIDRKKYNASDLVELKRIIGTWLSNYKKRHNPNLKYLIIPELHADKKHIHFHGLISGIDDITEFRESKNGTMRYNWTSWHNKFGFTSLEKIRDNESISKYITKYITKDLITAFGKHRYICSKGLHKPKLFFEATHYIKEMPCDFENDYVRIKHLNSYEEAYNELVEISDYIRETGGGYMWN